MPDVARQWGFTPDGKHLLTHLSEGKTVLGMWDTTTGRVARGLELPDQKEFGISSKDKELRSTSDGKKILMLTSKNGRRGDESILTVWDSVSGDCLRHERVPWGEDSVLTPDGESVLALDSSTGDVVLRALDTAHIRWRLLLARSKGPQQSVPDADLCLSADGRLFAARVQFYEFATGARSYDDIRIGEAARGRQLMKVSIPGSALFDFSADGRLFAVATAEVTCPHIESRVPDVWAAPNHNWLRITRILKSLRLLGLEEEAAALYQRLYQFFTRRRFPIGHQTFGYLD